MKRKYLSLILAALPLSFLIACGGSSSETEVPTEPPPAEPKRVLAFENIIQETGISYQHGYLTPNNIDPELFSGGVAAGDYDNDGDIDLFIVRGDIGQNLLYQNQGNNQFSEVARAAGLAFTKENEQNERLSGPIFADMDGDGDLDLFIGGFEGSPNFVFSNLGDGTFIDVSEGSGINDLSSINTVSSAFGDYDLDGDLDLFLTHWGTPREVSQPGDTEHLWRNESDSSQIRFVSVSVSPTFLRKLFKHVGARIQILLSRC